MNEGTLAKSFLRFMERELEEKQPDKLKGEVGCLFREDTIASFFDRMREEAEHSYDDDGTDPNLIAVSQAEKTVNIKHDVDAVNEWENSFGKWIKEQSPLAVLQKDLISRQCSPRTVNGFMRIAHRYMTYTHFEPEFSKDELFSYLGSLTELKMSTRDYHRSVLHVWWDALGITYPLLHKKVHGQKRHGAQPPPRWSKAEIAQMIKQVREKGTTEDKYYLALATFYAPRRAELGEITGQNFMWNGNTGTLSFLSLKGGLWRELTVPQELVSYLKDYSYQAQVKSPTDMGYYFHEVMSRIGFQIPKPPKRIVSYKTGKLVADKGHSWHAFRHSLDDAFHQVGIDEAAIDVWMGWSTKATMSRYYHTPDPKDADAKVMAKHPYLKMWSK